MAWGIWAIIAAVLFILEVITVDFTFLMVAGGALAATGIALVTQNLAIQIITFAIVATILLFFVRPLVRKRINNSSASDSNIYALIGKSAIALTPVDHLSGRVKLDGEVWSAKTLGSAIATDTTVVVRAVNGAQLVVDPLLDQQ